MKRGVLLSMLLAAVALPVTMRAQVSVYGEFTASQLSGGPQGDYLYGATTGVLIDGPAIGRHIVTAAEIQGRFVGKNGERLDGVTVGPRFSMKNGYFGVVPFASFDVGFARFNDGAGNASTDNLFGTSGGVTKKLSPRLDAMVDYTWQRYGYNFNFFQPQSYSAGLVYHFVKR